MKDITIKIKLSDLNRMTKTIEDLRQRLSQYEKPEEFIPLLDSFGKPISKESHPSIKRGKRSILEDFDDSFSLEYAYEKGANNGMIRKWVWKKYIVLDKEKNIYTKTQSYIDRLKFERLVLSDNMVTNFQVISGIFRYKL